MSTMTMAKAINAGLRAGLAANPKTLLMGEDIGALGGVYRITEGLQAEFGTDRVMDTPLAESGIIGTAIGLALRGYRPVCEIQFDGFVFPGFNQITTQLAKMHSRSEGALSAPVVIRIPLVNLWIQLTIHEVFSCGFPHSDIYGSRLICSSP